MSEEGRLWPELERLDLEYSERFIYGPQSEYERLDGKAWDEEERTGKSVKRPIPPPKAYALELHRYGFDPDRCQEGIDLLKSILAGERGPLTKEEVESFRPDFSLVYEHNEKNPDNPIFI